MSIAFCMSIAVWMSVFVTLMEVQPASSASAYRAYAVAMPGDPVSGKAIFGRETTGCGRCHTVGQGSLKAGPDLQSIGDKYPREDLIRAVLEPSAFLLTGYGVTTFVTEQGLQHSGIIARRDPQEIELIFGTGQRGHLAVEEIAEEYPGAVSLMPSGIEHVVTPREFADLIAYLETLRQPKSDVISGPAVPDQIARLTRPVAFEEVHSQEISFRKPIWFDEVPGLRDCFVVAQHHPPEIWLLEKHPAGDRKTLFLSLGDEAISGEDTGIVGMAFHPRFAENRRYFVYHHVREDGVQRAVLVERLASEDYRSDSGTPSRRVMQTERWTVAHTGGVMVFGPDGLLYVGVGDGGPQEDQEGNAQNRHVLLGSILRIDIDGRSPGLPYAIPETNPLFRESDPDVRKEIWAEGFRQPWRLSFDPVTHDLWVGDVGQRNYEEVTIVRAGENHGWNVYEGHANFSDKYRRPDVRYIPPVVSLRRSHGASVTGGHVYRGKKNPSYQGVYIFGDFESKRVWGLTQEDRAIREIREIGTSPDRIVSFGIDSAGELYIVGYDTGRIYQLRLEDSLFE